MIYLIKGSYVVGKTTIAAALVKELFIKQKRLLILALK